MHTKPQKSFLFYVEYELISFVTRFVGKGGWVTSLGPVLKSVTAFLLNRHSALFTETFSCRLLSTFFCFCLTQSPLTSSWSHGC